VNAIANSQGNRIALLAVSIPYFQDYELAHSF